MGTVRGCGNRDSLSILAALERLAFAVCIIGSLVIRYPARDHNPKRSVAIGYPDHRWEARAQR